jgi:hypothetical protein
MPCRACAATIGEQDRFCPVCGEPLPNDPAPRLVEIDVAELSRLREEKERVSGQLHRLLEDGQSNNLTSQQRRDWSSHYARWRELTYRITKIMDALSPRAADDRRHASGPHMAAQYVSGPGGDRRMEDRRDPFWHRAP